MNRQLFCLLCALILDWSDPSRANGQVPDQALEKPAEQAAAGETNDAPQKRSRRHSLGDLTVIGNDLVVKEDETARDAARDPRHRRARRGDACLRSVAPGRPW